MNPEMNITEMNIGGRLIPRSLVSSNNSAARLSKAINHIVRNNGIVAGVSENVSKSPTFHNSVHPYWRETVFLAFFGMWVLPIPLVDSSYISTRIIPSAASGQTTFGNLAV